MNEPRRLLPRAFLQAVACVARLAMPASAQAAVPRVDLGDGVTVELVAVSDAREEGKQWWRPDGTPLPEAPCVTQPLRWHTSPRETRREFVFRISGLPETDSPVCCHRGMRERQTPTPMETVPVANGAAGQLRVFTTSYYGSREAEGMSVGVAHGTHAWYPLFSWDPRSRYSEQARGYGVSAGPAVWRKGEALVRLAHDIHDLDRRLLAVTHDGQLAPVTVKERGDTSGRYTKLVLALPGTPAEPATRVLVQVRDFRWAEFRDVSLHPGRSTQVTASAPGAFTLAAPSAAAQIQAESRSPPAVPRKPGWGEEVRGLRARTLVQGGQERVPMGVPFRLRFEVLNVSNRTRRPKFEGGPSGGSPTVRLLDAHDESGAPCPVWLVDRYDHRPASPADMVHPGLGSSGEPPLEDASIEPGATAVLSEMEVVVQPPDWEGKILCATVLALPGNHTLRITGQLWSGDVGLVSAPASIRVVTGDGTADAPATAPVPATATARGRVQLLLDDAVRYNGTTSLRGQDLWSLRDLAWGWRCSALDNDEFEYLAHVAVAHPDPGYRASACDGLGRSGHPDAGRFLLRALEDSSPIVRSRVTKALRCPGKGEYVGPLLARLRSDRHAAVRVGAVWALAYIGSRRATAGLLTALKRPENIHIREPIVSALHCIADPAALPALRKLAAEESKDQRIQDLAKRAVEEIEAREWGEKE